jgi:hypothetical protein
VAYYHESPERIMPRNGTAPCKNAYPRSAPIYEPNMNPESMENPGSTRSGFRRFPGPVGELVNFGDHDALGGALMRVAQADMYDMHLNPWPAAGTYEEPGAAVAVLQMMRLQPTTSAHPGLAQSTGAGPTMLFVAPPVFSVQTTPIYATGL